MSKTNELIDRLIAIKDQLNSQYNKDTINEICGILHKIERGELVEVVRCKDCFYRASKKYEYDYCGPDETHCNISDCDVPLNFYCIYGKSADKLCCVDGERSGEL